MCTAATGRTQDCTRPQRQTIKSTLAMREPSTQDIAVVLTMSNFPGELANIPILVVLKPTSVVELGLRAVGLALAWAGDDSPASLPPLESVTVTATRAMEAKAMENSVAPGRPSPGANQQHLKQRSSA
jgi:hypothetical protein